MFKLPSRPDEPKPNKSTLINAAYEYRAVNIELAAVISDCTVLNFEFFAELGNQRSINEETRRIRKMIAQKKEEIKKKIEDKAYYTQKNKEMREDAELRERLGKAYNDRKKSD